MSATRSSEPPVAIVAALRVEVGPLERALGGRRISSRSAGQRFLVGELDGRRALLTVTGVGARAAAAGARRTLERLDSLGWKDARVAIVGVAGGLSPSARLGEVFVFERCVRFEEDPPKSRRLELRTVEGSRQPSQLLTLDRIVVDPADKRALWQRLGEPDVAAVDMETFHAAELLRRRRPRGARGARDQRRPSGRLTRVARRLRRTGRGASAGARCRERGGATALGVRAPRAETAREPGLGAAVRYRARVARPPQLMRRLRRTPTAPLAHCPAVPHCPMASTASSTAFLALVLVLDGCATSRHPERPHRPDLPERIGGKRTLIVSMDAVPFTAIERLTGDEGERLFAHLGRPVPLLSSFPSSTTLAFTGIFEPFGLETPPGYEARFFDRERGKVRGGGLWSYQKIRFSWREFFDWKTHGLLAKWVSYVRPRSSARKEVRRGVEAFLASDHDPFFVYIGATDGVAHLDGPGGFERVFAELEHELAAARAKEDFFTVVLSDHGVGPLDERAPPLRNVRKGVREALRAAGDPISSSPGEDGVALVPFGLLSSFVAFSSPERDEDIAAALSGVEGVAVCAAPSGEGWVVRDGEARAVITRRGDAGATEWLYEPVSGTRSSTTTSPASGEARAPGSRARAKRNGSPTPCTASRAPSTWSRTRRRRSAPPRPGTCSVRAAPTGSETRDGGRAALDPRRARAAGHLGLLHDRPPVPAPAGAGPVRRGSGRAG